MRAVVDGGAVVLLLRSDAQSSRAEGFYTALGHKTDCRDRRKKDPVCVVGGVGGCRLRVSSAVASTSCPGQCARLVSRETDNLQRVEGGLVGDALANLTGL